LLEQISKAQQEIETKKQASDTALEDIQVKNKSINTIEKTLQKTKANIENNNEAIQELRTSIEETEAKATELKATIDMDINVIQQAKIEVEGNTKAIMQSKANVDQLEAGLKAIADTADKKVEIIESFKTELEELNKKWIDKFQAEYNNNKKSFAKSQQGRSEEYESLKEKIENLLPGATSAGLSTAFLERKNIIENQKNFWRNMTIAGAGGLIVFGIYAIISPPEITKGFYEFLIYILTRSSILVGIIMIEEFGRRHFNIISRLAETYAYKEVLSRSFEGYKKQMETVDLESTITTTEIDDAGKENKKVIPRKASSKLSDNLLDNLGIDPASIYEKEKPIPKPVIDVPELAAGSINKAIEHFGKNKFEIGWRVFGIALAIVVATAVTIILLMK